MSKPDDRAVPLEIPGAYKVRMHWKVLIGRHKVVGEASQPPDPPRCPPYCQSVGASARSFAVFSPILVLGLMVYLNLAGLVSLSVSQMIVILLVSIVAGAFAGFIYATVYNLTESKYDVYVSVDDLEEVIKDCVKRMKTQTG